MKIETLDDICIYAKDLEDDFDSMQIHLKSGAMLLASQSDVKDYLRDFSPLATNTQFNICYDHCTTAIDIDSIEFVRVYDKIGMNPESKTMEE